jgi:hypothetical protein
MKVSAIFLLIAMVSAEGVVFVAKLGQWYSVPGFALAAIYSIVVLAIRETARAAEATPHGERPETTETETKGGVANE